MKKIVFTVLLMISGLVNAGPGHNGHRQHQHHHYGNSHWITPFIVGGVLGAVIVNQMPLQPQVAQPLPPTPNGYTYVQVYDYYCNCYRFVLLPRY